MTKLNPFLEISPRKEEFAPEKKEIVAEVNKLVKPNSFVIIYAERGMGRTLVLKQLLSLLKSKHKVEFYDFNPHLLDNLKTRAQSKKNSVIAVETLEISDSDFCELVLDELKKLHDLGNIIIATATIDTFKEFKSNKKIKSFLKSYLIPGLTYEQTKSMVVERLNDVRKKKSNSIDPFTEKEMKNIWAKSRGNPKLVLMICALLYDSKNEESKE